MIFDQDVVSSDDEERFAESLIKDDRPRRKSSAASAVAVPVERSRTSITSENGDSLPSGFSNTSSNGTMKAVAVGANERLSKSMNDSLFGPSPAAGVYDPVVFNILEVPPEQLSAQLTHIDMDIFRRISRSELSDCGWTKKDKAVAAPNVVALIRRFNMTTFWVTHEILQPVLLKTRVEVLAHFIRICKQLRRLGNINGLQAVLSALQSVAVFRLSKTWGALPKKERAAFDECVELMSEEANRQKLREYLNAKELPCIPYLGMYLTDIVFVTTAHPDPTNSERISKLSDVFSHIERFQQSDYSGIPRVDSLIDYLQTSSKYIDELQTFVEDSNFRLSLEREPRESTAAQATAAKPPKSPASPRKISASEMPSFAQPGVQGHRVAGVKSSHRRAQSLVEHTRLGSVVPPPVVRGDSVASLRPDGSLPTLPRQNLLDDSYDSVAANSLLSSSGSGITRDSNSSLAMSSSSLGGSSSLLSTPNASTGAQLLSPGMSPSSAPIRMPSSSTGLSIAVSAPTPPQSQSHLAASNLLTVLPSVPLKRSFHGMGGDTASAGTSPSGAHSMSPGRDRRVSVSFESAMGLNLLPPGSVIAKEGILKKKNCVREGKRATNRKWRKYWVALTGDSLVFFAKRKRGAKDRSGFDRAPVGRIRLAGGVVGVPTDKKSGQESVFQLTTAANSAFKFETRDVDDMHRWVALIHDAIQTSAKLQMSEDLMQFGDADF